MKVFGQIKRDVGAIIAADAWRFEMWFVEAAAIEHPGEQNIFGCRLKQTEGLMGGIRTLQDPVSGKILQLPREIPSYLTQHGGV